MLVETLEKIYSLEALPPIGIVPEFMSAQVIRKERYGKPEDAYQIEKIKIPELKDNEILIAVMAAGVNYNSVWASYGYPLDIIGNRQRTGEGKEDFHIAGSDCSGIIYQVGKNIKNRKVG